MDFVGASGNPASPGGDHAAGDLNATLTVLSPFRPQSPRRVDEIDLEWRVAV